MRLLLTTLLLMLPLLSMGQEQEPPKEDFAQGVVTNIEERVKELGEGQFVLVAFVEGSMEIVSPIKSAKDWDDNYRKLLKTKIELMVSRGGNYFQLLQLKSKENNVLV